MNSVKRPSRARALKQYFLELAGVYSNKGTSGVSLKELRAEAVANYKSASQKGLAHSVKAICFECVGGNADPGPKLRVRDCAITACHLHGVRPWQDIKGRKGGDMP